MIRIDVNVLVYAHRKDAENHTRYLNWLIEVMNSPGSYGMSDLVLSGFLRVVTHPKIFADPSPVEAALAFVDQIREHPNCLPVSPGDRHWSIFQGLMREAGTTGNLVPAAYLAASAIESVAEWITADRDYARFPRLRWRHPLS